MIKNKNKYELTTVVNEKATEETDHVVDDILLIDVLTGKVVTRYLKAHTLSYNAKFARSGKFFVTGSCDYSLKIFPINANAALSVADCALDLDQRFKTFCIDKTDRYVIGRHYYDESFAVYKISEIDNKYHLSFVGRWTFKEGTQVGKDTTVFGFSKCRTKKNGDIIFYDNRHPVEGEKFLIMSNISDGSTNKWLKPSFYHGENRRNIDTMKLEKLEMQSVTPRFCRHKSPTCK